MRYYLREDIRCYLYEDQYIYLFFVFEYINKKEYWILL